MADPREQIRNELSTLTKDGELLMVSEGLRARGELGDEVRKQLEREKKSRKRKSGKRSGKAARPKGSGASKLSDLSDEPFGTAYQRWYSRALRVVQQLLPDRYEEFRELNRLDKRPKDALDVSSYTISDYIQGLRVTRGLSETPVFDAASVALTKLKQQIDIVASAEERLDSSLADISGVLEASLFDDELSAARGLQQAKHLRAAGVVAGVVLEHHLKRVIANHQITFRKKAQIGNLNDALKDNKVYDVPLWRQIQRLADIRNLCGHAGRRDPTADEVQELIDGVEKVTSTVF